jgi:hypothetical protein
MKNNKLEIADWSIWQVSVGDMLRGLPLNNRRWSPLSFQVIVIRDVTVDAIGEFANTWKLWND